MFSGRRAKYGNTRTVVDGISFASKAEAKHWQIYRLAERAGKIADLQRQVPYELFVGNEIVARYIADFRYRDTGLHGDGAWHVIDVKGFITPEFKLKAKLMKACHDITVEVVR